nr:hypothetical protein [Escherichia coli]
MVAHALVNAALAVAQGNNALAGAAGAATGEVVGMIWSVLLALHWPRWQNCYATSF